MANEVSIKITSQDLSGPGFDSATARSKKLAAAVDGGTGSAGAAMESATRKAGRLGSTLQQVGTIASGVLAAEAIQAGAQRVIGLMQSTVAAATNLGESVNAVNQIFGNSAQEIHEWGEANANAFGLSQRAFNQLATPMGAMLKNQGLAMNQVTEHTIKLTERAADMASVFNTDVTDALAAVQAGLRGESDPLEQYGVSLNAAAVEARALVDTGKTTTSALTEQEKALARLAIIYDQTEAVAGDFRETSDSLANAQRIASAQFEEAQAKLGQAFAPALAIAAQTAGNLAQSLTSLPPPVVASAAAIGALGAAALLAAPRIIATKEAVEQLTNSESRTERVTGRFAVATAKTVGILGGLQVAGAVAGAVFGGQLNPQMEAATQGLEQFQQEAKLAGEAARLFGEDGEALGDSLEEIIRPGFGSDFAKASDRIAEKITAGFYSLDASRERVEAFDSALASLVKSGNAEQAARLVSTMAERADISIEDLMEALPGYSAAVETGAESTRNLGGAAEVAARQVTDLDKSFDQIIDKAFALHEVEDELADGIAELAEQMARQREEGEQGAGTLDRKTDAGRRNAAMVRELVRTTADLITKTAAEGKSTDGMVDALERQLAQLGLNRQQIALYTKALWEIPTKVVSEVEIRARVQRMWEQETEREDRRLVTSARAHGGITGAESPWPVGQAATGGARGGWTIVGERGREMVRLPFGSTVIPNGTTEAMLGQAGAGLGAEIVVTTRGNDRLLDAIVAALAYEVRTRGGGNVQTYLGSYHGVPG